MSNKQRGKGEAVSGLIHGRFNVKTGVRLELISLSCFAESRDSATLPPQHGALSWALRNRFGLSIFNLRQTQAKSAATLLIAAPYLLVTAQVSGRNHFEERALTRAGMPKRQGVR
jgi:hypothetical protein